MQFSLRPGAKLTFAEDTRDDAPTAWQSLADVVHGIVLEVQVTSAAEARADLQRSLPKAA
jgi:hypothetical protein